MSTDHTMNPDHDEVFEKYLELNPRKVNILGIFRVLFADDIEKDEKCKKFISSSKRNTKILERRGIIFLSFLAQKVLQNHEKLLSCLGSRIEKGLNVLEKYKGNCGIFLRDLLRGEVEPAPPNTSASYISVIGLLDKRVELDNNIERGTNKYFATLSAMASKLAYENNEFIQDTVEKTWQMELLDRPYSFYNEKYKADATQAFMFRNKKVNPDMIVVAFRGTQPFNADDWSTDFDISWYKSAGFQGKVHAGFMRALGLKEDRTWPSKDVQTNGHVKHAYNTITEELKRHFKMNPRTKFIVTGHSLGGALAVLFPAVLVEHDETNVLERLEAVYTFGQPRVGNGKFGKFMEDQFRKYGVGYYRFVYNHDIVPKLPLDNSTMMYKHFGTCIHINSLYEAKFVEEENMKDHFEWGSIVTKRVDALWEVVRGFLLPHMFGPDYKEGFLLQMFRMFGLLFPGVPAHGPQDYVNATRLATY